MKRSQYLVFIFSVLPAVMSGASVPEVLAKMDQSAPGFTSMSANLRKLSHTAVIDDNSEESGTMLLKRGKGKEMSALIEFTRPDVRTVGLGAKKAEIYYPKLKTVQEYNLSRYTDLMDQFMLVGFGTTGKEIAANYDVKVAGEETIGGKRAVKLELTPKTQARREKLKRLELWLADGGAYPVQQKFLQPSGDYTTFTYTEVKINPPLGEEALRLKLPKGTKREHPQR